MHATTIARAHSHPLRLALLDLLQGGPLTSAGAAAALATHTGATSFHLRQLERYGLVEPAGGGRGREKPWQLVRAVPAVADALDERDDQRWARWRGRRDRYPRAWRQQASASWTLLLTPAELEALSGQLLDLVAPYFPREVDSGSRPEGAQPVAVITRLFPDFVPSAGSRG